MWYLREGSRVKVFTAKPANLSSISEPYLVGGKYRLPQVVLRILHSTCPSGNTHRDTDTQRHKYEMEMRR